MKNIIFQKEIIQIRDKLYRMAYIMMLNENDALDITQEVLLILWEKRKHLKKIDNIEAYGITIVKNLCQNTFRRQNLFRNKIIPQLEKQTYTTYQNYEEKEALEILFKNLKEINISHRLIFEMKTIEGYSYEEIAAIVDLNIENLRKIVSRVRKLLRDNLNNQYNHGRDKNIIE